MSDDPIDAWEKVPAERVRPPSPDGPTIPPRQEVYDAHWEDGSHWRISPWIAFWAFVGGCIWACIVYSAYLIYMGVTQ